MSNEYSRAAHSKIISITDLNGNNIPISKCLNKWHSQAQTIQKISEHIIEERSKELIQGLYDIGKNGNRTTLKASEAGRRLGITLRNVKNINLHDTTTICDDYSSVSRIEKLIQASVITALRGQDTRRKDYDKVIDKLLNGNSEDNKLKNGWSRTVRPTPSKPGKVLDFSIVDKQLFVLLGKTKTTITFKMRCVNEWVIVTFKIPEHLQQAKKINAPKLAWNKNGDLSIILTGKFNKIKVKQSEKYIIGIDVGLKEYVTYAVYDIKNNTTIDTGVLSNYLSKELYSSIRKTQAQIADCWNKIIRLKTIVNCFGLVPDSVKDKIDVLYDDIVKQRSSLSHKRLRLACLAALELRDLSVKYDNALITRENLSWVGNTMQNGRWNCGELFKRIEYKLEEIGLKSAWVSAAYTSKTCSQCNNSSQSGDYAFIVDTDRTVHCNTCGYSGDRDVNAAINIAKRGVSLIKSMSSDYRKNKDKYSDPVKACKTDRGRAPLWVRKRQSVKSKKNRDRSKSSRTYKRYERELEKRGVGLRLPLELLEWKREVNYLSVACPDFDKSIIGSVLETDGFIPALVSDEGSGVSCYYSHNSHY